MTSALRPNRSRVRPLAAAIAAAAFLLGACGADDDAGNPESELTPEQATAPLEDAPSELVAIRREANRLLDGGTEAFAARLARLRGTPVVVNKWASWCGPCRLEFPFFQSQATKRGGEIAFLGIDSDDSEDAARTFLEELPLPYPSYLDPGSEIAAAIGAPRNFPATAFYDRSGELVHTYQGGYRDEEALAADIERHLR